MIRYLLDTGIAGDYINRRNGVFDRAQEEVARGNRIGLGIPVLAELPLTASSPPPSRRTRAAMSSMASV
jgi:hypothetical protein